MISVFFSLGIRTPFKLSPQPNESPAKRVSFGEESVGAARARAMEQAGLTVRLCRALRPGLGAGQGPETAAGV